ncbi:MAG: hypothetical protein OER43_18740, partial [Gammaproteobacteria bacterium]|nr:hypothetical protein [Gammaproteobacteria bacterium]
MKSIVKTRISTLAAKLSAGFIVFGLALTFTGQAFGAITCNRTLTADVVAFDMPLMWNRFGAHNINGMMFALRRDVVDTGSLNPIGPPGSAMPGSVTLRPDKRPRPLVLRMGVGDCLEITLENLLADPANPFQAIEPNVLPPVAGEVRSGIPFNLQIDNQVADRRVSLRFQGTELVTGIADDGSLVGKNASSLLAPGDPPATYTIYARVDGAFVGTSYGATIGGEGLGGNTANGLFAQLNVNPKDAAFYRSQLTREEMDLALDLTKNSGPCDLTDPVPSGTPGRTCDGHPIINYEATYPMGEPWASEGKAGLPIINMVQDGEIVHSDINAIVAYGPDFVLGTPSGAGYAGYLGHFPQETYPLESKGFRNPTVPNRLEPFREFTIAFHDEQATMQAFPMWFGDPILGHTLHGVRDSFMINYGSGGIGTEIISSRLRVGPPHDCINCAYEEFFLTAYTVGDVGALVDVPANFGLELCDPALNNCAATGPKANYALFPDDPSNVHHSYTSDATAFRNTHIGPGEQHVFHLHNHQWLFNADDDNSNYLDAQGLGPGSGYAYWVNFGGSGNRNKTAGDAIFHCHFYPHFAQGMWEMWRIHDVFEQGTVMQATIDGNGVHTAFNEEIEVLGDLVGNDDGICDAGEDCVPEGLGIGNGTPAVGARALPDAEILAGTPIPAVVPLPGRAMAPMPVADVTVKLNPNKVCVGPAPTFGLAAPVSTAPFACPAGFNPRNTGSLADVPRVPDSLLGGLPKNPGYPFWIAGIEHSVGQRPPTPPLDMITSAQAMDLAGSSPLWSHPGLADAASIQGWDGGLPRYTA